MGLPEAAMNNHIDIVFDGPPGPVGGKFVEVEDHAGKSISLGDWVERPDGYWALRITKQLDIEELLVNQRLLQHRMGHPTGLGEVGAKENLLHVVVEAVEALRELNFKPWKTQKILIDRQKFATELTDILQFVANAAEALDLNASDLSSALRKKWEVNHQRIDQGEVTEAGKCYQRS